MRFEIPYQMVDDIAPFSDTSESAAELHGILTGMLCVDDRLPCEQWVNRAFGDGEDQLTDAQIHLLSELCQETRVLLTDENYGFDLFLPDEDFSLEVRAKTLGEWCNGFLFGLGFGIGDSEWPGECTEILQDFMQIADLDNDVSGENSEEDLTELSEFVRVGVQVIRGELRYHAQQNRLH